MFYLLVCNTISSRDGFTKQCNWIFFHGFNMASFSEPSLPDRASFLRTNRFASNASALVTPFQPRSALAIKTATALLTSRRWNKTSSTAGLLGSEIRATVSHEPFTVAAAMTSRAPTLEKPGLRLVAALIWAREELAVVVGIASHK